MVTTTFQFHNKLAPLNDMLIILAGKKQVECKHRCNKIKREVQYILNIAFPGLGVSLGSLLSHDSSSIVNSLPSDS